MNKKILCFAAGLFMGMMVLALPTEAAWNPHETWHALPYRFTEVPNNDIRVISEAENACGGKENLIVITTHPDPPPGERRWYAVCKRTGW
ncbi:MAG: hypothetical protein HY559_00410 [Gammaproteobacteria bacterium]|nr:hypothetical protein [Gammaproteobacteria bacterium]